MELSWSTFILEIINFLVLVWILKRFLYRPVLNILEKRRQAIAQTLEDAEDQKTQATALEQQYQGRIKTWEQEKQQARDALKQELLSEKNRLLQQLQQELDNERQKAQVLNTRQQTEVLQQYQHTAHQQAAKFAGKLLQSVASPEMEV
ncbi:MAG: F0F1 ATP synthase subunit B, partial [Gammaproteobacteria bacterium]